MPQSWTIYRTGSETLTLTEAHPFKWSYKETNRPILPLLTLLIPFHPLFQSFFFFRLLIWKARSPFSTHG